MWIHHALFIFDYVGAECRYFETDVSNKNIVPYWKSALLSRSSLQLQADLMTINTVSIAGIYSSDVCPQA